MSAQRPRIAFGGQRRAGVVPDPNSSAGRRCPPYGSACRRRYAFTFASMPKMPDGFTIITTISRMKA